MSPSPWGTSWARYFLFLHFEVSFHRAAVPENWLRTPFLVIVSLVLLLQMVAFIKTIRGEREARRRRT